MFISKVQYLSFMLIQDDFRVAYGFTHKFDVMGNNLKEGPILCLQKVWSRAYAVVSIPANQPFFQLFTDQTCTKLLHTIRLESIATDIRFGASCLVKYGTPPQKRNPKMVMENLIALPIQMATKKNSFTNHVLWLSALSLPDSNDWLLALAWALQSRTPLPEDYTSQNRSDNLYSSIYDKARSNGMRALSLKGLTDERINKLEPEWALYWRRFLEGTTEPFININTLHNSNKEGCTENTFNRKIINWKDAYEGEVVLLIRQRSPDEDDVPFVLSVNIPGNNIIQH